MMNTKYGLIGKKLGHSFSVPIHNKLGNLDYSLVELTEEQVEPFMKAHNFSAINVTIPYKQTVMPFLDEIAPEALRIGSVNTVVNKDGKLYGYNTDYYGFDYMCRRAGIFFENKKVLILGTGGTCLTAKTVIADKGAKEIIIFSRNGEHNYSNITNHADADIIVNTTPVGMFPNVDDRLISLDDFPNLCGVVDVIYNPLRTCLLTDAKQRGIPYTNGLPMLVAQAKKAHEHFFDTQVDDKEVDKIYNEMALEKQNIVLVGMPGSGKSTCAKNLGQALNREVVDIDDLIVKDQGISIPEIFANQGEGYFRDVEAKCTKTASGYYGKIIACGGGTVLRAENREALLHNGYVIWLNRDVKYLSTSGRPLSQTTELSKMEEQRRPFYEAVADVKVNVEATPQKTLENIMNIIN